MMAHVIHAAFKDPWLGRPVIHDPFAGDGTGLRILRDRLRQLDEQGVGYDVTGTELEQVFIHDHELVVQGNALDISTYPPARGLGCGRTVIATSPVYPNGMADHHRPKDASKRYTYLVSAITRTDDPNYELHADNMARFGYRGTKRGGSAKTRKMYWELAVGAINTWLKAGVEAVVLNVSDFEHSKGTTEPLVDDWAQQLHAAGYTDQLPFPVGTSRMRNGANAERRASHEVVILARRP